SILRGLGLIVDGKLLNAAVALYGKGQRLLPFYTQCALRLARFRGRSRLADFADNRQYWGHAFDLLRRAESFLLDHVSVAGRIVPGKLVREDRPLYPPRATREALANALCHRDYTIAGGAVTVAMYDDRLEIGNPGALHFGLTPEKLFQPHESRPWNPIIAGVFYRAGIIEQWGMGTLNILDWCREGHAPAPEYVEQAGDVVVTFFPAAGFGQGARRGQPDSQRSVAGPDVFGQVTEQVAGQVLRFCQQPRQASEIQAFLGLRHRQTFQNNYLKPLLELGYLAMTVPDKPRSRFQRYRLTAEGAAWLEAHTESVG
ncbi:MAG: ATP-binding protein, partial [Chloroflexota bacterium]